MSKGGADYARVTCQTMMGVPKGVLVPDALSEVSSLWLIAEMDLIKLMPSECLMKCLKGNNKLLVGHPKRNPWPPPWLGCVVRGGEVWHIPWYVLDSFWISVGLMSPWPPPIRLEQCKSWEIRVAITLFVWKEQQDLVSYVTCTIFGISRMHELATRKRFFVLNAKC